MLRFLCACVILTACGDDGGAGTPDASLLAAPTLTARPGLGHTTLHWTEVPGATGYTIHRSTAAGDLGDAIAIATDVTFDDTAATLFTPLYYTVSAIGGAPSNQAEAFAFDLAHWTVRASGLTMQDVTFGNSTYVAVGSGGTVWTSADGQTWKRQPGPHMDITGITFGVGRFVAVGGNDGKGMIATSPDGITWTVGTVPTTQLYYDVQVAYSGAVASPAAQFIAVGAAGMIATSPDAMTWTAHPCAAATFKTLSVTQRAVSGTMRFGAIAAGDAAPGTPALCFSVDATTWNTQMSATSNWAASTTDDANDDVLILSRSGTTQVFHFDLAANVASSANAGAPLSNATVWVAMAAVTVGATRRIYAVDHTGAIQLSTNDCTSFVPVVSSYPPTQAGANVPRRLVAVGSTLFEAGESGQVYRSDDQAGSFSLLFDGYPITHDSVIARGVHVVVGSSTSGDTFVSDDAGVTWTRGTSGNGYSPIVATATGYAFIAKPLGVARSGDGLSWTTTPVTYALCIGCSIYSGVAVEREGAFVGAVRVNGVPSTSFAITGSADSPLTTTTSPVVRPNALAADTAGLTLLSDNKTWASTDGVTWTQSATLPINIASSYLDTGTMHYASDPNGALTHSSDGTTWSPPVTISTREVTALAMAGDQLIVAGLGGYLAVSSDAETFTAATLPIFPGLLGIAVTDRGFIVVGDNGVIMTAP